MKKALIKAKLNHSKFKRYCFIPNIPATKLHISIPIYLHCFGFFRMILKISVLYSPRNPTCRALSSLMYDNVSNHKKIRHVCSLVAIQISLGNICFSAWTAEVDCELSVMPFRAANCSYTSQGSRKVGSGFWNIFARWLIIWCAISIPIPRCGYGPKFSLRSLCATHVIIIKIYFLLSSCLITAPRKN